MKDTVQEFQLAVTRSRTFNPYALFAFELTETAVAGSGEHKGTYGELGVAPSWRLGKQD